MPILTVRDDTRLYYKDWGNNGPVFFFSHGRPLSSDMWESQMMFLASNGYRVVKDRLNQDLLGFLWQ